jgi:adenine nucleotide transporter 17
MAGTTVPAPRRKGTVSDLAEVVSTGGWSSLYAGLRPALLGTALSQGVYFYLYQQLREVAGGRAAAAAAAAAAVAAARRARAGLPPLPPPPLPGVSSRADLSPSASLIIAALAGCGNVLLTCPIWVVATRMQADRRGCAAAFGTSVAPSMTAVTPVASYAPTPLSVARELFTEGGLLAFWRGVVPSLIMCINPALQFG